MSDTKFQYTAGFDEWWKEIQGSGGYAESFAKAAWSEASLRMEVHKDSTIGGKLAQQQKRNANLVTKYDAAAEARMQVHRDDYTRSGILVAGLKRIEKLGGRAGKIAAKTLDEALISLKRKDDEQ